MREIKFRVWDDLHKRMLYNFIKITKSNRDGRVHYETTTYSPARFTSAMQYTGLKDKAGVHIYEGDVVRRLNHRIDLDDLTSHVINTVHFDDGCYIAKDEINEYFELNNTSINNREVEVIGNIHENQELI